MPGRGLKPVIDLRYREHPLPAALRATGPLPDWVDLRGDAHGAGAVNYQGGLPTIAAPLGPVKNQGDKGACVGYTLALILAALRVTAGLPFVELSSDFLWQLARSMEGNAGQNDGVVVDDAWKAARDVGVPNILDQPDSEQSITTQPTAEQRAAASECRIASWHTVTAWADVKAVLAAGYPLSCMIPAYDAYDNTGHDGVIQTSTIEADCAKIPNHETTVAGYWAGFAILQGSWGTGFAAHGTVLVPEQYMDRFGQYYQTAVLSTATLPAPPPF
jgi:hypothetical protein